MKRQNSGNLWNYQKICIDCTCNKNQSRDNNYDDIDHAKRNHASQRLFGICQRLSVGTSNLQLGVIK